MKCVLIGGSRDREEVETRDSLPTLRVAKPAKLPIRYDGLDGLVSDNSFETEQYRLERFHGNNSLFSFWLHESLTPDDAIRMLLNRYKKP